MGATKVHRSTLPPAHFTIHTEAELRFAIADPIVEMICDCWGYQVRKGTYI